MLKVYRFGKPLLRITEFMRGEAAGGFVLMAAAALALLVANSSLSEAYFRSLDVHVAGLSVLHWINDGLMAVFFLLVGLEIKREALVGQLATWSQRALPGIAAFGGMLVPALIFVTFNRTDETALRGWAIPTATDIAFALGVLALLGRHVPVSLKVFLTALAIIDDLGAVLIIAFFYSSGLSLGHLALAAGVVLVLALLNRGGVRALLPYLLLGGVLWFLVLRSGVHATLAGVVLALCIPLGSGGEDARAPLLRLEHGLARVVPFVIIPVFGFANAGLALGGVGMSALFDPLTLGIALGLLIGKFVGVLGFSAMAIRLGLAKLPFRAGWAQMAGIALLCGIGFTMSLFISLLAFSGHPMLATEAKLGILAGSMLAGLLGYVVLRVNSADPAANDEDQD